MGGPSWLAHAFAAAMIAITLYCAGRLIVSLLMRRHTEFDADGLHVAMGAAMAGMLLPRLSPLPSGAWEIVFGVAAIWFAGQAFLASRTRSGSPWCRYPVPHLIESVAMLYMFLAMPGTGHTGSPPVDPMPEMSSTFPALAMVFALFMLGHIVWSADQLTSLTRTRKTSPARSTLPDPGQMPIASGSAALTCTQDAPGTSGVVAAGRPARGPMLAPRLAAYYKIAMSITMGYMLILML
jgi:hypothetical protein